MLEGTCYCGTVKISIPRKPKQLTDCNCSTCCKFGALWAYFLKNKITIISKNDSTLKYIFEKSKKRMRVAFCKYCSCVTHYDWGQDQAENKMMAVNARIFELDLLESIPVKKLDGARQWDYVKGPPTFPFCHK